VGSAERLVLFHGRRYTIRSLRLETMSVAMRQVGSVTGRSILKGARIISGTALGEPIGITSKLDLNQRAALEQLLFFNVNQHRVRLGIQQSIETYGAPEIYEKDGGLRVRVGDIDGVQTLFAISPDRRPLGVAVFVRLAHERFVVLHLGVQPHLLTPEMNTRVLLKLMHEIRRAARRTRGVDRIELVYKQDRHAVRLHG
jgi:hypothetical protein